MTISSRSRQRIAMMSNLVAELHSRDLTIQQAADHLHMTHAGAKNYLRDMRIAGVVDVIGHTEGKVGQRAPIYHLTADKTIIDGYLIALRAFQLPKRNNNPNGTLLAQALKDPTRHLHLLRDDAAYKPVMHRLKPVRDDLVAALFGPTGVRA